MHSLLRNTVVCLALALPALAFAQSSEPAAPTASSPAMPAAAPATATASASQAMAQPAPAASADAAAPAATGGAISPPPAGKGQIVFFRPSKFVGAMISYMVREGDTELGKISNGSYFVLATDPGTHVYTVHSEAKDNLTLEVEAGETYYVMSGVTMGFMAGRPNLTPSDEATFDPLQPKLKLNK
jgi:hypothetical protein